MRRMNVLIVDDETFVVDWIVSLLDMQQDLNLNLFPCYGAKEARAILHTRRIDILLSDIRMPDGNGLDIAVEARRAWSHCKVLMLTAYAEFEYARRAVSVSVDGYILKTEDDEHILHEVHRVIRELNKLLDARQQETDFQQELDRYKLLYRRQTLLHCLHGDYGMPEQLARCAETLGLSPILPIYLVVGQLHSVVEEDMTKLRLLHVQAAVQDVTGDDVENMVADIHENTVVFLMQRWAGSARDFPALLEEVLEMVVQSCCSAQDFDISFAMSPAIASQSGIPVMYAAARAILKKANESEESFIYKLAPVAQLPQRNAQRLADYRLCMEKEDDARLLLLLHQAEVRTRSAGLDDTGFLNDYYAAALTLMEYAAQKPGAGFPSVERIYQVNAHE
ncbi:MAG: response regulator, partial [Clostridiales bacterium]|nr:response regulator [Clostridiales bacterium]